MSEPDEWYFNMPTGRAENGKLSPLDQRMGPYASEQEALAAWKIAAQRNKAWEEENKKWKSAWNHLPEESEQ